MSITLSMPELTELKPKIVVVGVGGAGGNAVNNMIRSELQGIEFVVANTDAQSLGYSLSNRRIQLGIDLTQGLGAGARPEIGEQAAREAAAQIEEELEGCHMAFITAGMGGGTGTGAAPVIANLAREKGILTVGVVTKPFQFEGSRRMNLAEKGIEELQSSVDTLIVIPNQNLFRIANEKTTFADAFAMADKVLHSGVRGITDLMVMPGLINLDFADVRTVMMEMGKAMMGTGEAEGEKRALEAAESAIANPLLDDVSLKGAKGVLINITGGMDMTLFEVDEAANRIRSEVDPEANIIVGSTFDENLSGTLRVSVFATGIDSGAPALAEPYLAAAHINRAATAGATSAAPSEAPQQTGEVITMHQQRAAADMGDTPMTACAAKTASDSHKVEAAPPPAKPVKTENESAANEDTPQQGETADAPFIAPEPVKVETEEPESRPDPFAEAAFTNARSEHPAREATTEPKDPEDRGPSLIDRMTGRVRKTTVDERREPEIGKPKASRRVESKRESKDEDASLQLGTVDADDRGNKPAGFDDQLEIPAFLRRQAN